MIKYNKMNKALLFLVSAVLLIGIVSASPLTDLLGSNQQTILSISISPHSTSINSHLDSSGSSLDSIQTQYGTVLISNVLNGAKTINTNLINGATSPTFSNVDLSGSVSTSLGGSIPLWGILDILGSNINQSYGFTGNIAQDSQTLTNLAAQHPLTSAIQGNTQFTKNGNSYTITTDKGFGDIPTNYISEIQGVVSQYSGQSFNVKDLITNYIFPVPQISNSLKSLLGNNLDKFNYTVTVPNLNTLNGFTLADGTYNIPVTFSDGTTQITKNIQVTLSGIIPTQNYYRFANNQCALVSLFPSSTTSNDYTTLALCQANIQTIADYALPLTEHASLFISQIKNLPYGITPVFTILNIPTATNGTDMTHLNALKIIQIDLPTGVSSSGDIFFNIDKSLVSNKNKISLYVLEGTSWTKLTTNYLSGSDTATEYTYSAHTPHFSTFMIAEDTTPSSSSSGSSSGAGGGVSDVVYSSQTSTTNTNNAVTTPINTENPIDTKTGTSAPITGGVIGFLSSGAGIVTILVLMIIIAGSVVLVVAKRKLASKK